MFPIRILKIIKKQGKSGCARVVYFLVIDDDEIWLFDIYDKADEEKIPPKTLRSIIITYYF